jgi:hypothetical protein
MNDIFAKRGSIACPRRGYNVACALSALSETATVAASLSESIPSVAQTA